MKSRIYPICMLLFFMAACSTELTVEMPEFEVTAVSATVKAGTPVQFNFSGTHDNISFYSGELRKDYNFKEGRVISVADSGAYVSFTSSVTGGTQQNQLTVLYSTDFNGNYDDLSKIKAATWTDVSSAFKLGTGTSFLASGSVDISSWLVKDKPIYFAFKYTTKPQLINGVARSWMIQTFAVTSKAKLGTVALPIINQLGAGFRIVDENPVNAPALSAITTSRITLLGNRFKDPNDPVFDPNNPVYDPNNPIYVPGTPQYDPIAVRPTYFPYDPSNPYNDPLSENWAVSTPINVDKIDLGPDLCTPIKSKDTQTSVYTHTYSVPGTYTAYFVAANYSIDDSKEVVKKIEIIVTP